MTELNEELWKYGILAKTQHNEVAPAQHELAPIFSTTNCNRSEPSGYGNYEEDRSKA